MAPKEESSEPTATSAATAPLHSKPYISRWRTAEERATALKAKKQRRRAAHRISLGRSHTNG